MAYAVDFKIAATPTVMPAAGNESVRHGVSPLEVWPGKPYPLGATYDGSGTNFAVFSEAAERVELCLFDRRRERDPGRAARGRRLRLARVSCPASSRGSATATACTVRYDPARRAALQSEQAAAGSVRQGHRRRVPWDQSLFSYDFGDPDSRNDDDSAASMPKSVVINPFFDWGIGPPAAARIRRHRHLRGARQGPHPDAPRHPGTHRAAPTRPSRTRRSSSTSRAWGSPRSS